LADFGDIKKAEEAKKPLPHEIAIQKRS